MHDDRPHPDDSFARRQRMVEEQIRRRGVRDPRVLEVMGAIPRERFVPDAVRAEAFDDRALPIEHGQTISQPYIVAYMTERLELTPACTVLEIGTGTGYQTAVLARLGRHVYTIERIAGLQQEAARRLAELGIANVTFVVGDGSVGLAEYAPFDRILVTAAAPGVPPTLVEQLGEGGVLVLPVGGVSEQTIIRVNKLHGRPVETATIGCRFVRLVGEQGWQTDEGPP